MSANTSVPFDAKTVLREWYEAKPNLRAFLGLVTLRTRVSDFTEEEREVLRVIALSEGYNGDRLTTHRADVRRGRAAAVPRRKSERRQAVEAIRAETARMEAPR